MNKEQVLSRIAEHQVPSSGKEARLRAYHTAFRELFPLVPHSLDDFTSRELAKHFKI